MPQELIERSGADIAADVIAGRASAVEVAAATLAHVASVESNVGAYLTVLSEPALAQAARVDERVRNGERLPLAGVPIAVKDNMCLDGTRTTCGSKILENWVAPYTATAVARMLEAGAVAIGKANCDEFAMGSSCENSALGVTRNPYDSTRVPGGSSGGSAAAVAAYEAAIGLGSDTGGSIREPGAFCNLIGFKPTYGRVSRYGLIAFASSLDQIGPLARTVKDAALAYDAMAGYDVMDATSIDRPVELAAESLRKDLRGLRVGIVREFDTKVLGDDMHRLYNDAYRDLERLGADIVEVSLPTADYGLATYYLIAPAECSSNLARFDGVRYGLRAQGDDVRQMYDNTRAAGFGPEVKRRILVGTYALSSGYYDAYYVRAQKARTLTARDFERAFATCDLIACPAASCPAFQFAAKSDPYSMYLMDYYTIPMSLAGLPALSVPCGWTVPDGGSLPMPIGLQLCAPLFAEKLLLGAAHAYEQATKHAAARQPALSRVSA
ncbi:MAG TPA: Asp-tRNA(Asn)/Glu-tRNA(Gln) amidotransferase subunit GatA [Candidatus Cybelea sp.]|jgi:aspartyl-tRNA(Asn)/glutamyl-tRNA(Gln) amidotransferase subunit A|nr:Asp-tRNA(Asn)/Glu-tRNA(Gln) amidotransferase subunit GatA [Candidatus Cybelea sp.]